MNEIRFIDLFRGIGGFRLGLERANSWGGAENQRHSSWTSPRVEGGQCGERPNGSSKGLYRCVWSNDVDKYASKIYAKHFGEEGYTGDIRGVNPQDIPDFDLLCAGFPCQAFSVAGKRKGFQDTRGTLFFEICRVASAKRPSLLLLENVKGLLNHDRGRTFTIILQSLDEMGYWVEWQVLNSKHFGVPQNRERVFIIGHLRGGRTRPIFPIREVDKHPTGAQEKTRGEGTRIRDEDSGVAGSLRVGGSGREENLIGNTLSKGYHKDGSENLIFVGGIESKKWLEDGNELSRNFPQGQRVYSTEGISSTLAGNAGGQGGKTGLYQMENMKIRRLTPTECERLQGFPDGWTEGISDTQRYKCLGNAVTVNVIEFLGERIIQNLETRTNEK